MFGLRTVPVPASLGFRAVPRRFRSRTRDILQEGRLEHVSVGNILEYLAQPKPSLLTQDAINDTRGLPYVSAARARLLRPVGHAAATRDGGERVGACGRGGGTRRGSQLA